MRRTARVFGRGADDRRVQLKRDCIMVRGKNFLLLCAPLAAGLCVAAQGATIFVSPCGNNGWTGANAVCVAPAGPKRTIQAAINAASNGDFVHVLPGTYNERIDLNGKAITLLGTGGAASTIIDGQDGGTVVTLNSLEGPGTVIRGFTIRDGNAAKGGGMLIALSNPTIEECVFFQNFADDLGGGVACIAASPTFTDCQFTGNEADVGGVDGDGHGGGVSIEGGSPGFTGCTFYGNAAFDAGGGAALSSGASPTFTDCHFELNSQWKYCVAEPCNPPKAGGAVLSMSSSPAFEGCTFHQNATGGHGAVMVSGGSAEFVACEFTENRSVNTVDPQQEGGALAGQGGADLSLVGCSFIDNHSNGSAGAVHLRASSLSATLCGFSNNIANDGRGGAIEAIESTVVLSGCTLFQNRSRDGGGAIFADGGSLGVSASSFTGNATGYDAIPRGDISIVASGGAIEGEDALVEVSSSTFSGNTSQYKGGAIALNPHFGAMFTDPSSADLVVENSTFSENTSYYGAGVDISAGVAHITGSTFEGNNAMGSGSEGVGGGLSIGQSGYSRVVDTDFSGNTAENFGGAIGVYGSLDAVGCTMSGNSAFEGGGVYAVSSNTRATVYSSRLTMNTASSRGSAAYVGSAAAMNLVNCVIDRNVAPANSAAVVVGSAGTTIEPLRVINCTIHLNGGGGGVVSNSAAVPVFVTNSIVWGHSGPEVAIFQGGVEYCNVQGGHAGDGNIDALPQWAGSLGGNYALNANSPCIDAGRTISLPSDFADLDVDADTAELIPLDFAGNARVTNAAAADTGCSAGFIVDIGAYEAPGVASPPILPGDANADGSVNFSDITFVLNEWGECAPCCPGDLDGNGEVGFSDITMILNHWS